MRERERGGPVAGRRPKTRLKVVGAEPPSGRLQTLPEPMRSKFPRKRSRRASRAGTWELGFPTARNYTYRVPEHSIRCLRPRPCRRRGADPDPPRNGGTPNQKRMRCGNGPSGAPKGAPVSISKCYERTANLILISTSSTGRQANWRGRNPEAQSILLTLAVRLHCFGLAPGGDRMGHGHHE